MLITTSVKSMLETDFLDGRGRPKNDDDETKALEDAKEARDPPAKIFRRGNSG